MPEQTLLHDVHARSGASFVEEAGWLLPGHFGDTAAEYRQACAGAVLFERSQHGKIEATGKEAASFLHNLSSNDIVKLPAGQGCEAFLATAKAKVVALVHMYRHAPDVLWIDAGPGLGAKVREHLDRFIISEQLELVDRSRDFAQFHLAGPQAATILKSVFQLDVAGWKDLQHATAADGVQVRRHDCLSVPGYDVLWPRESAESGWQTLLSGDARPAGNEAYHLLRIEAGTPQHGVDIDENNLVMEVNRTPKAVSYTKGCFLGQEPIVRARDLGHVNRTLGGLRLPAGGLAQGRGAKLFCGDKDAGQITSAIVSPRLGAIALAFIRRGNEAPGTALEVEVDGARQPAVVSPLPFTF